ncbi:peptidoglycan-recognition protein LC-like [Toxorhynchites rutilus septentrionalis]|uniref:peptidoglycan-recognition protein LC-like n=1 Tax=Toxorhynchites rutilus septentrionalis TaxID=329112 RepID=UPI00247B1F92|nr:peptidoglycan-recognition protein LC-like [Toxorhynchites rutilus septentrionalis]
MAKAKNQLHSTTPSVPDATILSSTNNCNSNSDSPALSVPVSTVDKTDSSSSHNISISSINENDDNDSSDFESSESECDDVQIDKALQRIPNALQPGGQLTQNGSIVVKEENDAPASARGPNIGSIAVQNSSDITFGNKTYIKGQVVIKNIYRDRQNGVVNEGYQQADEDLNVSKQASGKETSQSQSWQSNIKAIIRDKPLLSVVILVSLMVIITTIVIVIMVATSAGKTRLKPHYGDGDDDRAYVPPDTGIDSDFLPDPKPLRIVTRNEWLASPPKEELTPLTLPVSKVIIAHTATEGCTTQTACVYRVRIIQEFHLGSSNLGDIGYNFLIGGDGNVYEGRGWFKVGAFLRGQNSKSEGIAFIGNYLRLKPTDAQMEALDSLLLNGTKSGYIKTDYKLYGARQWQQTESPGDLLYERLQKHPHWSDDLSMCVFLTGHIQQFHMAGDSKNFSDIAYNFLVGGEGNAYEGRGWESQGAHTKGFNKDSICIAFIGTFSSVEPSKAQLSAAQQLIALGVEENKLAKNYRLYGHRQLAPFESPGRALYKILQKWPHWANELSNNHWSDPEGQNSTRQ